MCVCVCVFQKEYINNGELFLLRTLHIFAPKEKKNNSLPRWSSGYDLPPNAGDEGFDPLVGKVRSHIPRESKRAHALWSSCATTGENSMVVVKDHGYNQELTQP